MFVEMTLEFTYLYKVQYVIDFVGILVHIYYMLSQLLRPCMDTVQTYDYKFSRMNQLDGSHTLQEFEIKCLSKILIHNTTFICKLFYLCILIQNSFYIWR